MYICFLAGGQANGHRSFKVEFHRRGVFQQVGQERLVGGILLGESSQLVGAGLGDQLALVENHQHQRILQQFGHGRRIGRGRGLLIEPGGGVCQIAFEIAGFNGGIQIIGIRLPGVERRGQRS